MKASLLGVLMATWLTGCANISSIDRTTSLPGSDDDSKGRAIHLDAKQRLAFAKGFGVVCAEPSPDALSAYAASIGGGLAIPQEGAASVAQAFAETSASIGLRTQSITLMRDALYRVCEAYYNRALNGAQVMALLSRSQDLTLAVLAVEQLTGPVAARQAALGSAASAAASSNLAFIDGLLEQARKNEQAKIEERDKLDAEQKAAKQALDEKAAALTKAKAANESAQTLTRLEKEQSDAQSNLDLKKQQAAMAGAIADEAKKTREAIEKNHSAALTSAAAHAQGNALFANAIQPVTLDQKATEHIAKAVQGIVTSVIGKSYLAEACMAFVTRNTPDFGGNKAREREYNNAKQQCQEIVEQAVRNTYKQELEPKPAP